MNTEECQAHRSFPWLTRLCKWLPPAIMAAAFLVWAQGFSFPTLAALILLLLCPGICLVLYLQSKDTERKIAAASLMHEA